MSLKSYVKSVVANKFALLNYAAPVITAGMIYSASNPLIQIVEFAAGSGITLLLYAFTDCGRGTQYSYEETKKLIQHPGRIDENFKRWQGRFYCEETGMYMAARELGVEDQLPPRKELSAMIRAVRWAFSIDDHYDIARRNKIRQELEEDSLVNKIQQLSEVMQ